MIDFDRNGNPTPVGLIGLTTADFKVVFVDNFGKSETRNVIFNSYNQFILDFQNEVAQEFKNWINGSFTTTKENPNDIDIVSVVNHTDELNSKTHLLNKFLTQGGSKDQYLVDGYFIPLYPETDPRYVLTQYWMNYWLNWFGMDRQGRPKGIIQLSFHKFDK